MVNPELIAEAFINRVPYYDGTYIVVHNIGPSSVVSAIGIDMTASLGKVWSHTILFMQVRNGEISVAIDPRWVLHVEVLNAVLRRLRDVIGVEMGTVKLGDMVCVVVKGFKYIFIPHNTVSTIISRGNVCVYGYVRRFAPFSRCPECIEIAERIKEAQRELDYKRRELEEIMYSLEWGKLSTILERAGVSVRKLRMVLHEAEDLARQKVVIEGLGISIGSDSPRALLRRYLRALGEINELVAKIKEEVALEKLLS